MSEQEELTPDELEDIADRIRHILSIYPGISPTMLQAALGPQTSPSTWKPVLEDMITNKIVARSVVTATTPKGRSHNYMKYTLVNPS